MGEGVTDCCRMFDMFAFRRNGACPVSAAGNLFVVIGRLLQYMGCLCMLLCLYQTACSQELLANNSFENENICTEYAQNCAPEAWICTSLVSDYYVYEPSFAYNGTHFLGLVVGNERRNGARSFVRSRLLCGLRKGKQYKLEFYTRSWHNASDSLGIYFSPTDFLFETRSYKDITPSLWLRDSITHHSAFATYWAKHTLLYTATGDEVFFTIGSFRRTEYRFTQAPDRQLSYYLYIDQISMTPVDDHEKLCSCADSIRNILYSENERHNLLDKKIYAYKKKTPFVTVPPTTVIQKIDTLVIPDVLFATASALLDTKSFQVLDSFSHAITAKTIDSLVFEGHTDSVGTMDYNLRLSAERANAVADYITQKANTPVSKIQVHAYAYLHPRASNLTPQGRQKNRRVEVYLYTHE